MLQNHSSVTLFILCVYECLMNIFAKFYRPTKFQSCHEDCGKLYCGKWKKIYLRLPQYKLSSPTSQLWHMLGSCD